MSSSQDTPGSPDSSTSRKRKSPFDSPVTPGLSNKRKRGLLSLRREHVEQHSEQSNDSSLRCEDEDSMDVSSVSVISLSSAAMTDDSNKDFRATALQYGVSLTVAKENYDLLNNQPSVAIIKIAPIKRELLAPAELEAILPKSPVLSTLRRKKRKSGAKEQGSSSFFSESDGSYFANDILKTPEPVPAKELPKRVKQNVENYLQTLNGDCDIKEEKVSPKSTSKKKLSLQNPDKSKKEGDILINPFFEQSTEEPAKTNPCISKPKESLWLKKYGSTEDRKKTLLKNFTKKKDDSETETANELESTDGISTKKVESKKANQRRKRIIEPTDDDSDSEVDDQQTYDSRSVNCGPLFSMPIMTTKSEELSQSTSSTSPLLTFGEGSKQQEEEEEEEKEESMMDVEQEQDQDDVIDLCDSHESIELVEEEETTVPSNSLAEGKEENTPAPSNNLAEEEEEETPVTPNNLADVEEETPATNKNLVNGEEESADGNLSDCDLFDSPKKPGSPSDRLVIDLTAKSSATVPSINIDSSPSNSNSPNPKRKPKITSDTKLTNNIVFNRMPRKKSSSSSASSSPSSSVTNPSEAKSPSTNGIHSNELDSDGPSKKVISLTPTTRGLKGQQVKCNLNDEKSVKEYQKAKSQSPDSNRADESFEKICQDLTDLSNPESITLYKGDEGTESSSNDVVATGSSSEDAQKGATTSSAHTTDDASEKQSATESSEVETESATETPSPAPYQSPQFNFKSKTPPSSKLNGSGDKTVTPPNSQQKVTKRVTRSLSISNTNSPAGNPMLGFRAGFTKIPRKNPLANKPAGPVALSERDPRLNKSANPAERDPRLNRSASSVTTSERDPRLNRSASPSTPKSRDPRLNRSISPIKLPGASHSMPDARLTRSSAASIQKSSAGVSPADPRLSRGQSRPRCTTPTPQTCSQTTNISPSIAKGEEVNIVDPRLRKRKEREEAEKLSKLKEQPTTEPETEQPQPTQFGQSSPVPERKRNVFQRLGIKEPPPAPTDSNELYNIIKSTKTSSPTKSIYDDDDLVSLHPGLSDFFDSDEEDIDSSPRHRKFESERNTKAAETTTSATAAAAAAAATTTQTRIPPHQRLSVKDRLGLNFTAPHVVGHRQSSTGALGTSSTLAPPAATNNALLNRQARFGVIGGVRQPGLHQQQSTHGLNIPPPNHKVPASSYRTPNNSFNMDSFYRMNAMQFAQDQRNLMTDNDPTTESYVTFDNGDDEPNEYDHISILDNKPDTVTVKGLSDPKYTFFKNQCYRVLRDGKCKTELSTCGFSHGATLLLKTIKSKHPQFIRAVLDTSISENFDYYLDNVWKEVLPIIKDDAFAVWEKLYQANKRDAHFILDLLNYYLSDATNTVEAVLLRIAPVIDDNDSGTVQAICVAVKSRIAEGFCWETIKSICKKAAPPKDMIDIVLMQCLKRKKNRSHILEVNDMIKRKMLASERSKISVNLMKQFQELVERNKPSETDRETLSTMPLNNVTNNLMNGQSFARQSVNVPKTNFQSAGTLKTVQAAAAPQPINNLTKKVSTTFTPSSPNEDTIWSPNRNGIQTPTQGESVNSVQYRIKQVEAAEPKSIFRERYWKLFSAVQCVENGLKHVDYDYVWTQMQKFTEEEISDDMCKQACYQILCKNVKNSERHLTEILKRAGKAHVLTKYLLQKKDRDGVA